MALLFNRRILAASILALAACGGGGGSETITSATSPLAQQCAPANPHAASGSRTGSLDTEKGWIRWYMDQTYLWYDEVPGVDASLPAYSGANVPTALDNYFRALRTPARDRFSFTYPTADWNLLSQSGIEAGYGIEWSVGSRTAPRDIRIAYVQPASQAAGLNLQRGDVLVSVDGVSADDTTSSGVATLNAALFPPALNATRTLVFRRGTTDITVNVTSANVTKRPVLTHSVITAAGGAKVGYIAFTDHIETAEQQLIDAVTDLRSQNVTDLVLDIRYNGGGYLYIASELAYMIAGPGRTAAQVFEQLTYSGKRQADSNSARARTPFYNATCDSSACALPSLDLPRVYVITKSDTCSASESIINGLRGVDVEVHQIGSTTCGKPYGFTAKDNCGISYFPIEFKGANAKGFGDYADGFTPGGTGPAGLPGCAVADDFSHALGDTREGMLAAALQYRATGACPAPSGPGKPRIAGAGAAFDDGFMLRSPGRENRITGRDD